MNKKWTPPDQSARDMIKSALDRNILVEAAAGTGKTTSMVGRMVALIRTGACKSVSEIAAITFTRKATAELQNRFQVALEEAARDAEGDEKARLQNALSQIEQCTIGTIHAFCAKLLRERPVEAGVDPDFQEVEEDDANRLANDAWDQFCASLFEGDSDLLRQIQERGIELRQLKDSFGNFVKYADVDEWPVPERSAERIDEAELITKLNTYLAKISEMVPYLPKETGTDKLIPRLQDVHHTAQYTTPDTLAGLIQLLECFDYSAGITQYVWTDDGHFTKDDAKSAAAEWKTFKEDWVQPYLAQWAEDNYGLVLDVYQKAIAWYDALREERNLLTYQDLLCKATDLLQTHPVVRNYFRKRYTHLLVDEFHDTDPIQAQMVLYLTATDINETDWRKCVPAEGSLFVVGDPKQSIYRFRRADIETYNKVKGIIAAHGEVLQLSTNFRSDEPVIFWANRVFEPMTDDPLQKEIPDIKLRFDKEANRFSPAWVPFQVGRVKEDRRAHAGVLPLHVDYDKSQYDSIVIQEADEIAKVIRHALDNKGYSPEDFLIVTRMRNNLDVFGKALQAYGIPHEVTGGDSFSDVEELRLLTLLLRCLAQPDNPVALIGTLRSRLFGIDDQTLYAHKKHGGRFHIYSPVPEALHDTKREQLESALKTLRVFSQWLEKMPPIAAIRKIATDSGLLAHGTTHDVPAYHVGAMQKAFELLRDTAVNEWSTEVLITRLEGLCSKDEKRDGLSVMPDTGHVVRVMNLHKVKGLEAPVVFLAGLYDKYMFGSSDHVDRSGEISRGYFTAGFKLSEYKSRTLAQPAGWDELSVIESEFDKSEQLRLRYVAATRAKEAMFISVGEDKPTNPWLYFAPHLDLEQAVEIPDDVSPPRRDTVSLQVTDVKAQLSASSEIWDRVQQPGYGVYSATGIAHKGPWVAEETDDDDALMDSKEFDAADEIVEDDDTDENVTNAGGAKWGTAIHRLLELKMKNALEPVADVTLQVLTDEGVDTELQETAISLVNKVTATSIWQRAKSSDHILTEVPFEMPYEKDRIPGILRGVIDMMFREPDGWVIVDYKTDSTKTKTTAQLTQHYRPQLEIYKSAFEMATGETVKEMGLLFTGVCEFCVV
ncbi:MAG: UvrD-helicase domain-containing protein [Deltaproteobacteria bacterium]|nr:UvrD-helicase domain-containing protein [Deltaproteobacteria bacterium]